MASERSGEEAINELIEEHIGLMYKIINEQYGKRFDGPKPEHDDFTQDVMLRVLVTLHKKPPDADRAAARTYLARVTGWQARDIRRLKGTPPGRPPKGVDPWPPKQVPLEIHHGSGRKEPWE